ncbi:MAG: DUF1223 domain-containing protein [Rhodocyclaceae bacterium]
MRLILPGLLCALACTDSLAGGTCSATANKPVALLELYTSEGCSSCPPADRWLSLLGANAKLRANVVPLAFHVPYWDYIGWKDRFASPQFEQRQRQAAQQRRSPTVYTPQVLFNGVNLGDWYRGGLDRALAQLAATAPRAMLTLSTNREAGDLVVSLSGQAPARSKLWLARYENGLSSSVKTGENAGVLLRHDQVVRELIALGNVGTDGKISVERRLPQPASWRTGQGGIAAFAEDPDKGLVLQAVLLPACESAGP